MTPLQTIQSVTDAFVRGDIPYIVSLVAPGATWNQTSAFPWGGERSGPEGAAQFFAALNEHMETTGFEIREMVECGENVFATGSYSGIGRKTGKSATNQFLFRWKVVGGKITSYQSYFEDTSEMIAVAV